MDNRNVYDILSERGYIAQCSNEEAVREYLAEPGAIFYIGFDPTADSLHIGHFIQLMIMSHMQNAGHIPIALIGGGTTMVGDPTGRTDLRQIMTADLINENGEIFKEQMSRLIDFSENKAMMVNNADWLLKLNYIEFLREIGPHFSVNRMLTADCYKKRLEVGLTFLEFNYMLMQSYDFLQLYKMHGCRLQMGGDDQWSNILAGADLIRRKEQADAHALTFKLLTTSEGIKMGKTAKGAVWLSADKLPIFEFYQYWRNIDDADTINCMKLLTFLPLEEIEEYAKLEGSAINEVKKRLALEITALVHGRKAAEDAQQQAQDLFEKGGRSDLMNTTTLKSENVKNGMPFLDLLLDIKIIPSKSEGRRLVQQGGVFINDVKIDDFNYMLTEKDFKNNESIIRKGKKTYHRLVCD